MKNLITKYKLELVGLVGGSIAGWCYWYFVGCASGTCAITSSPVNSTLYGAFMGAIVLSLFKGEKKREEKQSVN